jgi:hypothetical protein
VRGQPKVLARKEWPTRIAVLALGACLCAIGCSPQLSTDQEKFNFLFSGFELKLVDDLPSDKPIQEVETRSLQGKYLLEPRMVPGRVYVLRKANKTANETLAIRVLPERLAKIGARVTKAPQSEDQLLYPFIGGPMFLIEFELNGHQGKIFNRVGGSAGGKETWEELILAFK